VKNLFIGFTVFFCVFGRSVEATPPPPEFRIAIQPRLLTLKQANGKDVTFCLAAVEHIVSKQKGSALSNVGPTRSCSGTPDDYVLKDEKAAEQRGMDTFPATSIGKRSEIAIIGSIKYFTRIDPSAIIYRTIDASGKEVYNAVCVAVKAAVSNTLDMANIVYPRTNISDPIEDFHSKVECDGIGYAVRNEIKTVKPDFIGTPEQLSARTAHPQVIQSAVGFGVPVSSAHK
jgi:hypothetical protein